MWQYRTFVFCFLFFVFCFLFFVFCFLFIKKMLKNIGLEGRELKVERGVLRSTVNGLRTTVPSGWLSIVC